MTQYSHIARASVALSLVMALTACAGGGTGPSGGNVGTNSPRITSMAYPSANETNVRRDTIVSANLFLPTTGKGVETATLKTNVVLYRASDGKSVVGTANTDGAGANLTFTPSVLLEANTKYTFEVKSGLKDEAGAAFAPFKSSFTTGLAPEPVPPYVNFSSEQVYPSVSYSNALAPVASLAFGPDNRLYGVTLDGKVLRWTIESSGTLAPPMGEELALPELAGRAIIGLAFDPTNSNVLWISHNAPLFYPDGSAAPDFSGEVSKLNLGSGPGFTATLQRYIVGLPRSTKDHLTNSLAFNKAKDRLYVSQGSNSATGAWDGYWNRPERLLSGAVLEIDPRRDVSLQPINVQTEPCDSFANCTTTGNYQLGAGAPVTIYADGVRNAYDLIWHSNGYLYMPTNGSAAGGNTPAGGGAPALTNAPVQKDFLFRTNTSGGYYGHPNPLRGHYVLNGGNPTSGVDRGEVVNDASNPVDIKYGYPVGVQPDPKYRGYVFDFGKNRSPNGVIEYKSSPAAFGDKLKGKLLVVEYAGSSSILVLVLNADGTVKSSEKIGFTNTTKSLVRPLDLIEDPRNGNIYVAELETQPSQQHPPRTRITLLKPAP